MNELQDWLILLQHVRKSQIVMVGDIVEIEETIIKQKVRHVRSRHASYVRDSANSNPDQIQAGKMLDSNTPPPPHSHTQIESNPDSNCGPSPGHVFRRSTAKLGWPYGVILCYLHGGPPTSTPNFWIFYAIWNNYQYPGHCCFHQKNFWKPCFC